MGAVFFYHLTQRSLAETLRMLLEKSLANDWRVVVRGTEESGLRALDNALWLGPEDAFLPHAMAGGDHDSDQPVLLTTDLALTKEAHCVMSVAGAEVTATEVEAMERVCIIFDGNDDRALNRARGQWKSLKDAGVRAQYWSENSGRWEKKAET
ncbi:DNA polymerase III subunit chi [Sulfitobacter sp. F26204]|uniref:DNA polymerase III subunit chi n=1 Tax=Sulfitobacter sp. F26204 TaxID=2996014 RepID=UPI00225E0922|nr:DNA polymerase III subunit chi [Sulfitobacter sp. F26204]MCX7559602.1 DNA polymerase III subunit chi [Sulfitobacter sp. F26204]